MKLCGDYCTPLCPYCIHAAYEEWDDQYGNHHRKGPVGCGLHQDKEHQEIIRSCGHCQDFRCFRAKI